MELARCRRAPPRCIGGCRDLTTSRVHTPSALTYVSPVRCHPHGGPRTPRALCARGRRSCYGDECDYEGESAAPGGSTQKASSANARVRRTPRTRPPAHHVCPRSGRQASEPGKGCAALFPAACAQMWRHAHVRGGLRARHTAGGRCRHVTTRPRSRPHTHTLTRIPRASTRTRTHTRATAPSSRSRTDPRAVAGWWSAQAAAGAGGNDGERRKRRRMAPPRVHSSSLRTQRLNLSRTS